MDSRGKVQESGRVPPSQPASHTKTRATPASSKAWFLTSTGISKWISKRCPKPRTTAECSRQHLPKHQPSSVKMDLKSNEIRQQAREGSGSFNEQNRLCRNTASKTFCFRGQAYCPYITSAWQRKEHALSSFCWMQPQSKITSEAVNNNFESISTIV